MLFVRVVRAPDITECAKNGVRMYGTLLWAIIQNFRKICWEEGPYMSRARKLLLEHLLCAFELQLGAQSSYAR